jgi:hypothetical protein
VVVWVVVMVVVAEAEDCALAKEARAQRPAAVNANFMVMVLVFLCDKRVSTEGCR